MKKNIAIVVMAGLAVYFFFLWQSTEMGLASHKKKVAQLAETVSGHMKTNQENFEWQEFLRRTHVEYLMIKLLSVNERKGEEIRLEINKRLLGYSREINIAESRRELIQKLLQSPFGKEYLALFAKEARETIRIYKEEGK